MAKMFKSLLSVFLAVFMVVSLMAIPSSAVSISKSSITVTKGYQATLSVSGTSKAVTWSTGDKSIATVSSKGKVVGKKPGTTYVYAKVGGTTLKCKVTVVAAKLTASSSNVTFDKKGDTKTITMTVKGSHSGLTVNTSNKNVATASWVKPVSWDGDKVKLTITAKGPGTATIKVYLKNYPSTCYSNISVKVGGSSGSSSSSNSSTDKMSILTNPKDSIEVATDGTAILQVYATNHNNLAYTIADTSIATATGGAVSANIKNFTIKGLKSGTTTIRFYDKNDTSTYCDVKIVVKANTYYEFYTTRPDKQNPSDSVCSIQVGSTTYYMLVPANYDPAYVNSLIGPKFNQYAYYEIYTSAPSRINSGDTYREFYHTNTNYSYGARYVLLPKDYDEVLLNTAIAQYNNRFEYWTVYAANPTRLSQWDYLETWTVMDSTTGKATNRYLLVPYTAYDSDRIKAIKEADIASNSAYSYYVGYTTWPSVNNNTDKIISYRKGNTAKYMVVPKDDSGIAKANDAIAKDTGIYEYNVIYSAMPAAGANEKVVTVQSGSKYYYVLIKSTDNAPDVTTATNYADGYKDN